MLHGYLPAILGGLGSTLSVAATSLAIACLFGIIGAAAKLSDSPLARGMAQTYTTLIRGVPELVLMLLLFYGGQIALNSLVERMGWGYIDINPFAAGTLVMGFIFGAFLTETFRGAILAIPLGQIEAAQAFGMTRGQVLRRITLPQMVRHALPGFTNSWLVMLKASALVSIIGLDDMVHRANLAAAATRKPFTFYATIALIYLALTTISILALGYLERRYSHGVRKVDFR
ncbi:MAG: ABC transporter permease [Methylobacterium sp.]|jgi:His/Glu/Gln/Arg/opine family amino acid ABC transporter permease subunit|nr:ABC transporter permease [Methylobacterium sp.]MCA3596974.1 ABC transporter permease [Methylobacterium sp.]MCA3600276.1 ABC transporter permease [Methylobacterium sp.]MCA3602574.1 ABC transporter permease [Methylobacterium sp.]MCA3605488.1 ABC transporter permease [Methylobacterium sp.]